VEEIDVVGGIRSSPPSGSRTMPWGRRSTG
jgi:hypothetical protein